jgi:hypothetical protein
MTTPLLAPNPEKGRSRSRFSDRLFLFLLLIDGVIDVIDVINAANETTQSIASIQILGYNSQESRLGS